MTVATPKRVSLPQTESPAGPPEPGVYIGRVRHRRFTPADHSFRYGICLFWFNVEEPQALFRFPGVLTSRGLGLMKYSETDYGMIFGGLLP